MWRAHHVRESVLSIKGPACHIFGCRRYANLTMPMDKSLACRCGGYVEERDIRSCSMLIRTPPSFRTGTFFNTVQYLPRVPMTKIFGRTQPFQVKKRSTGSIQLSHLHKLTTSFSRGAFSDANTSIAAPPNRPSSSAARRAVGTISVRFVSSYLRRSSLEHSNIYVIKRETPSVQSRHVAFK